MARLRILVMVDGKSIFDVSQTFDTPAIDGAVIKTMNAMTALSGALEVRA